MYLIVYVVLIVIMSYFIMNFVSDDKNKGDQAINQPINNAYPETYTVHSNKWTSL